jgi:hypothetical protein
MRKEHRIFGISLVACLLLLGSTWQYRSDGQTTRNTPTPLVINSADQLKGAVGQRIYVSGKAIGGAQYKTLEPEIDTGFEILEIPEMLDWPEDVFDGPIVVTGELEWHEPIIPPPDHLGGSAQVVEQNGGFFYLQNVQWSAKKQIDLVDIVALTNEKSIKELVGKQVLVHGLAQRTDGGDMCLKCSFYSFATFELRRWPDTVIGHEIYVIATIQRNEPIQVEASLGEYSLKDVHWVPNYP